MATLDWGVKVVCFDQYINIIGIIVGLIGIIVGLLGAVSLRIALKSKNIANKNRDSTIQQAHTMTVNHGMKSDDVINLAERAAMRAIENIPAISDEEIDEMFQIYFIPFIYDITPSEWVTKPNERCFFIKAVTHGRGVSPSVQTLVKERDGTFPVCDCDVEVSAVGDVKISIGVGFNICDTIRVQIK